MAALLPYVSRPDFGWWLAFGDPNNPAVVPDYIDFTSQLRAIGEIARGRQYELALTLPMDPSAILRDRNEYLNPANPSSPYYPNVDSYRRMLHMGLWPNTTAGNLFNANYWGISGTVDPNLGPRDPSLESYAFGTKPPWISDQHNTNPTVQNTDSPHTGARNLRWTNTLGGPANQGIVFGMRCMPGRYYTISAWVLDFNVPVNSLQMFVDNTAGPILTVNGVYTRLSMTFLATKPQHLCFLICPTVGVSGFCRADDFQMEQAPALNANVNFQYGMQGWTATGCTIAQNNVFAHTPEFSLKLTPDGVSSDAFAIADKVPVVAGQPYLASGWAYSPTGTGAKVVGVRVNWYNGAGSYLSTSAGTEPVLGAGVWTLRSNTFTAPALAAFAGVHIAIGGTPAATNIIYADSVQIVSATPTTFTTTGPTIYPIQQNFAERFQKTTIDNEYNGLVGIPCVDAMTALSATRINTEYAEAVAATLPSFWYSLNVDTLDTSGRFPGVIGFPDTSGNQVSPLYRYASKYGQTTVPAPGAAMNIPGDPGGTGVQFTNNNTSLAVSKAGTILANGQANAIAGQFSWPTTISSWGATLSCWFNVAPVTLPSAQRQTLVWPLVPGNAGSFASPTPPTPIALGIAADGTAEVFYGGATLGSSVSGFGPVLTDSKPHHFVATVLQSNITTTVTYWIDGVQVHSGSATTSSLGGLMTVPARSLEVGGLFGYQNFGQIVNGAVSHVAGWDAILQASVIATLWTAGQGYPGELVGNRIARHFALGGYPAPYRISANTRSTMQPPSYAGSIDLATDTQNSTVAEFGNFWIGPDGAPVVESRADRYLRLSPLYTFGNVPGATPIDSPEYDTDPTFVYATVQVSITGANTLTGGLPNDIVTASQRYFGRTYSVSVDLADVNQAQDLANWIFYTHNRTLQRIAVITIDPAANPALWPVALGVEVGNRIRCSFVTPAANGGAGFTNTADFFVENVTHTEIDVDAGTWVTTLLASPIGNPAGPTSFQPWILEDSALGVLGSTTRLGY